MITKTSIIKTLDHLDRLYNSSQTVFEATFYSKLAVIECCGWIEMSMDDIADTYVKRKLKTSSFHQIFSSIKEKNHGFQYSEHFRRMLYSTIGLKSMESIEKTVNGAGAIDVLKAQLESLRTDRNDASHTYINATKSYPAPSLTKGRVVAIYGILKQIDAEVRKL